MDYARALAELKRSRHVTLTTHVKADSDGLACIAVLRRWLQGLGKTVEIVLPTQPPARYAFLGLDDAVRVAGRDVRAEDVRVPDLLCIVDTGTWQQLSGLEPLVEACRGRVLVIDHHQTQDDLADVRLADAEAPAAAVLVHRLLQEAGAQLDATSASWLLAGLPLPDVLPGLQLSYFGVTGKGNSATYTGSNAPDWHINTGFISYESKYFTVSGEVCRNKGNQAGTWLTTGSNPKTAEGYSLFGFVRIPCLEKLRVHGRYDYFDPDVDVSDDAARLLIAGLSYDVYKHNMAMLNYERFSYDRNHSKVGGLANADDYEHKVQFVYQISF